MCSGGTTDAIQIISRDDWNSLPHHLHRVIVYLYISAFLVICVCMWSIIYLACKNENSHERDILGEHKI